MRLAVSLKMSSKSEYVSLYFEVDIHSGNWPSQGKGCTTRCHEELYDLLLHIVQCRQALFFVTTSRTAAIPDTRIMVVVGQITGEGCLSCNQ